MRYPAAIISSPPKGGYAMIQTTPDELLRELAAAWERDPYIDLHHYPIKASLHEGTLVLEGSVEDICAKKTALKLAHHVAANVPVLDRLRITSRERKEDGALRAEVVHALLQEPVFSEYRLVVLRDGGAETVREAQQGVDGIIEIEVEDAVVKLTGHVGSLTHRRLAEVLVWWIAGSEAVDNRLRVSPPEQENDGELADAVRIVLEKDPLVHAGQLSAKVEAHTVTLDGYVASAEEQRLAVLDTWYVPGVRDVVDRIQSRS
jgi:osmotically-inducible protein OsmY